MKIEGKLGSNFSRLLQPRPQASRRAEAAKFTAWKNVNMIDVGVAAQERDKFGINHPGDFGPWMRVTDRRNRGQGVNDVAERAWLDD